MPHSATLTTGPTRTKEGTMIKYTLPDLGYGYDALEPWYSAELLELHHGKHHAA